MTGSRKIDIAVIGAGAAGLMAAIHAARAGQRRVVVLEGAARPGAKILVSGGGRCNLTNVRVDPADFSGSSPNAIKKILLSFNVQQTLAFFYDLGLRVKTEDRGRILPVDDRARSVLDVLLNEADRAGAEVWCKYRVEQIQADGDGFSLSGSWGSLRTERVILATGGLSLPKSGSDGGGLRLAEALGHTLTPHLIPALVPLLLPNQHPLTSLSGLTHDVQLILPAGAGVKRLAIDGALLCTHLGLSGPAVLDISRHYLTRRLNDQPADLQINWLPGTTREALDGELQSLKGRSVGGELKKRLPDRLVAVICDMAKVGADTRGDVLPRAKRLALVDTVLSMPTPIRGDRGFRIAEVTAGGVPLAQLDLKTLESRVCPGLYLCGEVCDVDGRIGGFNFQWAWSSGAVAGMAAGRS